MESPTPRDNVLSNPRTLKRTKRHPKRQWHLSSLFILATVFSGYSHADVVRSEANEAGVMVIRNADVKSGELNLADLRAIFAVRKRSWDNKAPIKVYVGVLGIFRPKTTRIAESPAIRGLPGGITFPEPVNIPRLCASVPPDPVVFHSFRRYRYPSS